MKAAIGLSAIALASALGAKGAAAADLTLCWAAWDPANALVELSKDFDHYAATPDPFAPQSVDALITDEMEATLALGPWRVTERWLGTYASAPDRWRLTDAPDAATRVVIVTAGCGASTGFAIGEETVAGLFD